MKTRWIALLSLLVLPAAAETHAPAAPAPIPRSPGGFGILLGGGYLDDPGEAFGYGQFRWTPYEDAAVAHTLFLEFLFHTDDATLVFAGPGGVFTDDGDLTFSNLTVNYEAEFKVDDHISVFGGGGLGVEFVSIDDRYDYLLDSDENFVAQVFAGVRGRFANGATIHAGVRRIFREDFALLGDQFVTNDSWAFEVGVGFRF